MSASSLRIIVTGLAGLHPVGGVAWDYLQYVLGLARLGHDVYYHEDTWSWPYHPIQKTATDEGDYSASYIGDFFARFAPELSDRWHYLHLHETSYGMRRAAFDEVARTADLFINVSGSCMLPDELSPRCTKVFLDTDPGYNQVMLSERFAWSENVERWCASVEAHDRHFTYGENIHGSDCLIPKVGFDWKTTRMPVVLSQWERIARSAPPDAASWTTVMTWNAFKGRVVYEGVEYKSKGAEFKKLADLPGRIDVPLRVAVGGMNAPLEELASRGWSVVDGPTVSLTPGRYQDFLADSRGEVSTAKQIYVAMRSGWFSCRSACYLAAGRPVVVQDTGFSSLLPVGDGILSFTTVDQAADAIRAVEADYARHAKAARDVAEAHFDSDRVLVGLIDQALGAS
jgi:hypothetical protein